MGSSVSLATRLTFERQLITLRLQELISTINGALKWKICHMQELDTWTKVRAAAPDSL
jgi:hypothetical protein